MSGVSIATGVSALDVLNPSTAAAVVGAAASAQSSALRFCIPGRDASTAFSDISGNAATCVVDAGNTGAFATADYMATIAATNGGLTIAGGQCSLNFSTDSFILAFTLKMAAPGAHQNLLALHADTTGGGNTGIYISHRTTGALKIMPVIGTTITNAQADSALSFSDGTPRDRHCVVAYDAPTGVFSIYRDGVLSNAFTGTPMVGANAFPNATQSRAYRIGGIAMGAPLVSVASLTYGHQLYSWAGSLPVNIGQIASMLANNPLNPLPLGVWR